MKKPTERMWNVICLVVAVAMLAIFTMTVSAAKTAAMGVSGAYTVSVASAPTTVDESIMVFHTPASIGSSGDRAGNNANDVACGVFASILEKQDDLNTFSHRILAQGRPDIYIIEEAKYTRQLLNKLAMMQGVPVKDLLAEMYPAMCSHIKA